LTGSLAVTLTGLASPNRSLQARSQWRRIIGDFLGDLAGFSVADHDTVDDRMGATSAAVPVKKRLTSAMLEQLGAKSLVRTR